MRDQLVRYILGELNNQEQEQLEAALRDSPEMQRELDHLQKCMQSADETSDGDCGDVDRPAADAPGGLAARTLAGICGDGPCRPPTRTPAEITAAYDAPASTPRWSLADITAAGGVFLAVSMLFVPALSQSRDAARRTDCVNNLRQLGVMLTQHSDNHGGFYLTPARNENAGIFAVYLAEEGYGTPDEIAGLLICRSSAVADDIAAKRVTIRVPSLCELEAANARERCFWKRMMSPSYAYRIGFIEEGQYCAIRNERSCHKAVLADTPCMKYKNLKSDHHGGQNVLFQSGSVRFQRESTLPDEHRDMIYLNTAGKQAAGLGRDDAVLGPSEMIAGAGM